VRVRSVLSRALLGVLVLLAASSSFGAAAAIPPASGAAPAATSVRLLVEPGTTLENYTPTTFRATVLPSTAQGTVAFRQNGEVVARSAVVGGQAVYERNRHPVGRLRIVAEFEPAAGSDFLPAQSAPLDLVVNAVARLSVERGDGSPVAVGGEVPAGAALRFVVEGFPADTRVSFSLGATMLPEDVLTDVDGVGRALVTVPESFPERTYLIVAAGGQRSAVHKVAVLARPTPAPSTTPPSTVSVTIPGPSPSGTTRPTAGPTPSPGPTDPTDLPTTGGDGGEPGGSGGTLPQTGGDPGLYVGASLTFLVIGAGLTAAGRPRPAAAHLAPRPRRS
jgi:hypothetical protein